MDGASNIKRSGEGIILEGPCDMVIEQTLKFEFTTNNNHVEYEALIVGITIAFEMGATILKAKSDSQLIVNQVSG